MKEKKPSKSQWQLNYYLFLIAVFFIFLAINAVSFKRYYRLVLDRNGFAELTDVSKKLLNNLPGNIDVTLFIAFDTDPIAAIARPHLDRLIEAYRYSGGDKIFVKRVDPFIDQHEAVRIAEKYKLATNEDVIIVEYGERFRIIRMRDIVDIETDDRYQGGTQKLAAFKGEQELSSAIHSLTEGRKKIVYFLEGHGEYDPFADINNTLGYSIMASYIQRQNVDVRILNLASVSSVPEDADLLIVAGPKSEFQSYEKDMISAYLTRGGERPGRLILMLDPQTKSGMEDFLGQYGVKFRDDLVIREIMLLGQKRILIEAEATEIAEHASVEWLLNKDEKKLALGISRSLAVEQLEGDNVPLVTELLKTPNVYWGESTPDEEPLQLDEGKEASGSLTVSAIIDAGSVSDGEVQLNEMRALAVGSASFLVNDNLTQGDIDFFLNGMNWMLGKENLLGISPKQAQEFTVSLSDSELNTLRIMMMSVLLAGMIAGILVWLRRRQ